jgi:hypothetical protein
MTAHRETTGVKGYDLESPLETYPVGTLEAVSTTGKQYSII